MAEAPHTLSAGRHPEKAPEAGGQPLPTSTGVSITVFEKTPILRAFKRTASKVEIPHPPNQLTCSAYSRTVVIGYKDVNLIPHWTTV
jgi:hypothetical protein